MIIKHSQMLLAHLEKEKLRFIIQLAPLLLKPLQKVMTPTPLNILENLLAHRAM